MAGRVTSPKFIEWLNKQLDLYHWNDSQASKLAGLDKSAISAIRSGINPGPKRVIALARLFGRPVNEALYLAGYMLPDPPTSDIDAPRIRRFLDRLKRLPLNKQDRIIEAALLMVEVAEVVEHAATEEGVLRKPD